MAQIIKYYTGKLSHNFYTQHERLKNSRVVIYNQILSIAPQIEKDFASEDVVIYNPTEEFHAGGEGGVFPNYLWIYIALEIVVNINKGFWQEFGKELGKKLLKQFVNRQESSRLIINQRDRQISILVPPRVRKMELENLEKITKQPGLNGSYIYSKEYKTLIKLD